MAKRKPTITLVEMERKLGYKIDDLDCPDDSANRFYSDFRPVLESVYKKTKKEFEEYQKQRFRKDTILEKALPGFGGAHVTIGAIILARQANINIDNCTWSGHSDFHTEGSCRLLQFCCRYPLLVWINLAVAIH